MEADFSELCMELLSLSSTICLTAIKTWRPADLPRFVSFLYLRTLSLSADSAIAMMTSSPTLKHLSSVANDVVHRCAQKLGTSTEELVEECEGRWKADKGSYSRMFVEFCSAKTMAIIYKNLQHDINDGSFSRLTFDMMLAWEVPSVAEEESSSFTESSGKEVEDKKLPEKMDAEEDDTSLFYSDLMPLLVDNEADVGEDAFVWLGTVCPLIADVINGRFIFEILTAPTAYRLHFPAYDKFLKETDKSIKHLQAQWVPKGVVLADHEFILHVEGTSTSLRVVRHIGATSRPGRLTLTNYALYFEASGIVAFEDAVKIDLSKNIKHTVKPASTGPWGAPLFDKAIVYESPEISEGVTLEFPEITSSSRRDRWLVLTKEIMLLHRFLVKFEVDNPIQAREMHGRTILGIARLHAARELLKISPPPPTKFLIFTLCDELPKGDYILEELAESLKTMNSRCPCSASSVLKSANTQPVAIMSEDLKEEFKEEVKEEIKERESREALSSLETAVNQAMEEEKEMSVARATAEALKEEGVTESALVLLELLKPIQRELLPRLKRVVTWKKPTITLAVVAAAVIITYKEWVGKALAALLLWVVAKMVQARKERVDRKCKEIVVSTASEQITMESIVSAQHGLQTLHEMVLIANVAILKVWSLFVSKTPKQSNMVMTALSGMAIVLAFVPTKFIIIAITLISFCATSRLGKYIVNERVNRRLKEWWESVPVIQVKVSN